MTVSFLVQATDWLGLDISTSLLLLVEVYLSQSFHLTSHISSWASFQTRYTSPTCFPHRSNHFRSSNRSRSWSSVCQNGSFLDYRRRVILTTSNISNTELRFTPSYHPVYQVTQAPTSEHCVFSIPYRMLDFPHGSTPAPSAVFLTLRLLLYGNSRMADYSLLQVFPLLSQFTAVRPCLRMV